MIDPAASHTISFDNLKLKRFFIVEERVEAGTTCRFRDALSLGSTQQWIGPRPALDTQEGRHAALSMFIPPYVAQVPMRIGTRPGGADDLQFWQYPAITEQLAWERHAALPLRQQPLPGNAPVETYVGQPWATYIDKGKEPTLLKPVLKTRLSGYRALAEHWGFVWGEDVRVHTVCQHIYWQRLLPLWQELGITDLHLSHCEPASSAAAAAHGLRVHSWPLAAANVVNSDRQTGWTPGRPLAHRSLLASFIGAHMPHYRSEVRLALAQEVAKHSDLPLLFSLGDNWHFNELVYDFQVAGKPRTDQVAASEAAAASHYNAMLSDSVFSLCPEGAGPNTLRLWESLATGSIPVVIVEDWLPPLVPPGAPAWEEAVIWVQRHEVAGLLTRLDALLREQPEKLQRMQKAAMALYEAFQAKLCFGTSPLTAPL